MYSVAANKYLHNFSYKRSGQRNFFLMKKVKENKTDVKIYFDIIRNRYFILQTTSLILKNLLDLQYFYMENGAKLYHKKIYF